MTEGRVPSPPTLSVIIPVHNGAGWIGRCIEHVERALDRSSIVQAEIIVVDDGSVDTTVAEVNGLTSAVPLSIIEQPNLGRFRARSAGLDAASHEHVLLIDTRVFLHEDALRFVADRLAEPATSVWMSHVVANTDESDYAGFWQGIEHVAWRRYWRNPRTTSYRIDEFDYYPKGTTALLAPRATLIEAFDAYEPTITDWSKANDDTAVLRWVAERVPINISPEYASRYHARSDLKSFLEHANHRGTVLIDGYLRPGTRFAVPIVLVLAATPVGVVIALRHPRGTALGALGGAGAVGALAYAFGARRDDAFTLAKWSIPFGLSYLAGMWRGAYLRVRGTKPS